MNPLRLSVRNAGGLALIAAALLVSPARAEAFDTAPHTDITRDAMTAEGFGSTATDVVVANNWLVDLYFNSKVIPQSGHADWKKELFGSLLGPRENWPRKVRDGAERMHFDASIWDVFDARQARREFERVQRAATQAIRMVEAEGGIRRDARLLAVIGITLHSIQDFYAHSNWIEQPRFEGADGPDWTGLSFGHTPAFFDVPEPPRDTLNVYIGGSTFHKQRPHGKWNTNSNTNGVDGVNKDWPGRPGYDAAYMAAYFATRQWLRGLRPVIGEAAWSRLKRYSANERAGRRNELNHELHGSLNIGMMSGHWQGQGEPCAVSISTNPCGDQDGLGGDLIGARNALRDYFDPGFPPNFIGSQFKTSFRFDFEWLIPLFGEPKPTGDPFPVESSQPLQRTTSFVRLRVTSMKTLGLLRPLGDPGPLDRADMFTRATIAGQEFQSGEINGRDSFSFPKPYAPFEFIKAIPNGATYAEPVTNMTVEIRTSSSRFSGTDDDVYLRVSTKLRFPLEKRLYNDFERGDRDTYSVPIDDAVLAGLDFGDIDRVQVEKGPDGVGGGWKLRGVKLNINGRTVYARDRIERWLENNRRTWRAPDFQRTVPRGTALPITLDLWDEDSFIYGDNDHGDIDQFGFRKRLAVGYTPGSSISERATAGGRWGGRIRDGDEASLTYKIETLTPTAAPLNLPPIVLPPVLPPVEPPVEPPPPPVLKPDLVISDMGYNDADKYFFTVKNQGDAATGPFKVSVTNAGTYAIPALAPGASATRTFRELCQVVTNVATADVLGEINESDETNNTRSHTEDVCVS
jgi:hypothetical protein